MRNFRALPTRAAWMIMVFSLLAAFALGAALRPMMFEEAPSVSAEAREPSESSIKLRLVAERHDDGRVEVGLQQQDSDGGWGATIRPEARFLSLEAESGQPYHSSQIAVSAATHAEAIASQVHEFWLESGTLPARWWTGVQEQAGEPLRPLLCISDGLVEEEIDLLCEGLAGSYAGQVDRLLLGEDLAAAEREISDWLLNADGYGMIATGDLAAVVAGRARKANELDTPMLYWATPVTPLLPEADELFCVVTHRGEIGDFFWGLANEVSERSAAQLGLSPRIASYADSAEQAGAIRECVEDGAAAVATTFGDAEAIGPAVAEARAAGTRVISFNSGTDTAAEGGSSLHLGIDDHEAGRLAGESFSAAEIEGTVLCVIHEANNIGLEERCDGLEETYSGAVERLRVHDLIGPGEIEAAILERIGEGGVGSLLTLNSSISRRIWQLTEDGELIDMSWASFGLDARIYRGVADGRMLFAIPDYPDLQSRLAVAALLYVDGLRLPASYLHNLRITIQPEVWDAEYAQTFLDDLEHRRR